MIIPGFLGMKVWLLLYFFLLVGWKGCKLTSSDKNQPQPNLKKITPFVPSPKLETPSNTQKRTLKLEQLGKLSIEEIEDLLFRLGRELIKRSVKTFIQNAENTIKLRETEDEILSDFHELALEVHEEIQELKLETRKLERIYNLVSKESLLYSLAVAYIKLFEEKLNTELFMNEKARCFLEELQKQSKSEEK